MIDKHLELLYNIKYKIYIIYCQISNKSYNNYGDKMKINLKHVTISILCLCLCIIPMFMLSGCCLFYEMNDNDKFAIGYNKMKKDAFISHCYWDEGEKVIVVPDNFSNAPITTLGGYFGRGVPSSFGIVPNDRDYNFCTISHDENPFETYVFTVKLGKNIKKIARIDSSFYFGKYADQDMNKIEYLVCATYHFEVDEQNKTFYAKDGKLYYKSNNALVEEFIYA